MDSSPLHSSHIVLAKMIKSLGAINSNRSFPALISLGLSSAFGIVNPLVSLKLL